MRVLLFVPEVKVWQAKEKEKYFEAFGKVFLYKFERY